MVMKTTNLAMLFAAEVWAVYGIATEGENTYIEQRADTIQTTDEKGEPLWFDPSISATFSPIRATPTQSIIPISIGPSGVPHASPTGTASSASLNHHSNMSDQPSATLVASASSSPSIPTPTTQPTGGLDTGAKVGIGIVSGFVGIVLILFLAEACYLRRKRREKALERAVNEIERGERNLTKGSEEIIVLESRVSIVFQDASEDEDEEPERGRGRNGLSLPRRMY